MFILLLPFSLSLLKFTFSSPVQPINSKSLTSLDPLTLETGGQHGIDPRFSLYSHISNIPLDQDQWLVSAVKAMGNAGSKSLIEPLLPGVYDQPDDKIRQVGVSIRRGPVRTAFRAQFAIWGFYLAIKSAIADNVFTEAVFLICWESHYVGSIVFWRRPDPFFLPGEKSTQTLQQAASSNQSAFSTTGSPDETNFNLSAPSTDAKVEITIDDFGKDLSRNDIIWTMVECISAIATSIPKSPYPDAIIISPPPYTVQLHILPDRPHPLRPRMTVQYVNFAIKWIPSLLLQNGRWSEAHFDILIDKYQVAHGLLVKGVASTLNGTSIS